MNQKAEYDDRVAALSWGYRQLCADALAEIWRVTVIDEFHESRQIILAAMDDCDDEHAVAAWLQVLAGSGRILLRRPGYLRRWLGIGRRFMRFRSGYARTFFESWPRLQLCQNEAVRFFLDKTKCLQETHCELASAFVEGFLGLSQELTQGEIDEFIDYALIIAKHSVPQACAFLTLKTENAHRYVAEIATAAKLDRERRRLTTFASAVAGRDMQIMGFDQLDSDDLIERGSSVVCAADVLFLPTRMNELDSREENREYYLALALIAALTLRLGSFSRLHGREGVTTLRVWTEVNAPGADADSLAYYEVERVLYELAVNMPGYRRPLREFLRRSAVSGGDRGRMNGMIARFQRLMERPADLTGKVSRSWQDSVTRAQAVTSAEVPRPFPALVFFPDYFFPVNPSVLPPDVSSLSEGNERLDDDEETDGERHAARPENAAAEQDDKDPDQSAVAEYFYPEWDERSGDYLADWCRVCEEAPRQPGEVSASAQDELAKRRDEVERIFTRLQPRLIHREKYVETGDRINIDELVRFVSERQREEAPTLRFYDRTAVKRRDVAVSLLLDISGSTAYTTRQERTILDVEKTAAYILAEGLLRVGDAFSVSGFTGNGRNACVYTPVKMFSQEWSGPEVKRLWGLEPGNATRIGAALRHTTTLLSARDQKTKLMLLITDGRPMDTGYDPNSRYAHYDVRHAVMEAEALGIHTFAISTEDNSADELELMFPNGAYRILGEIDDLPDVLTKAYLSLTKV